MISGFNVRAGRDISNGLTQFGLRSQVRQLKTRPPVPQPVESNSIGPLGRVIAHSLARFFPGVPSCPSTPHLDCRSEKPGLRTYTVRSPSARFGGTRSDSPTCDDALRVVQCSMELLWLIGSVERSTRRPSFALGVSEPTGSRGLAAQTRLRDPFPN